jgi:hypothetical protein
MGFPFDTEMEPAVILGQGLDRTRGIFPEVLGQVP